MVVKPISLNFPSSLFGGTLDVTNVKVNGISKAKIMNLKANVNDVNKFRITMDVYYPHVLVTGNYKMVGNIARIPIKTDGDWSAALDGVTVLWEIKGLPEQRSQNIFLRMNRFGFRSQPEFKHLKFYASNLVPRNENLNDFALRFLNRNYQVIYNQIYPYIEKKISDDVMIDLVNTGLAKIPFEVLFPLKNQ
ncbi:uncharacterized protein LOC103509682 [Diaphorina citri]|uniref:Uncharacterized protein LOC103509682 n=1 Tax=Diaphorina citri TaxID=121845 RepID=A0A1S3D1U5_DIACI|nr:uncharacterized protein LOC103509682 [Diaphorina citri]